MKKEQIQYFTRKISQCNRGGLVVVMYDILFVYLDEAKNAWENDKREDFKTATRRADAVIKELMESLDFKFKISAKLYPLYVFCRESLAKSMMRYDTKELMDAREVLLNLYDGFQEAAKQDQSGPLMKNAQQVVAGITYGKNDLSESFQDPENSRGFFA